MKIAILGTRGIPNNYGGFEEFAEHLSQGLTKAGHEVFVYSPHKHPYQEAQFEEVQLIHRYDPEHRLGTFGQFIYDFNCIWDSRRRGFDIILQLGYTSSSIWHWLFPRKTRILTNMDGLEWKRSKYKKSVQHFLKYAEKLAVNHSHVLIADSKAIQKYLDNTYQVSSVYIPYGATPVKEADETLLEAFGLSPYTYNMLVARLEPENNIETILKGVVRSESQRRFLVIGNTQSTYGQQLKQTFRDARIRFLEGIYDKALLNSLRYYSHLYFHGHSVGGTNPSLLEAMACGCLIGAHHNAFNQAILEEDAWYFVDEIDVKNTLDLTERNEANQKKISNNLKKIEERFSWKLIIGQYELVMQQSLI